MAFLTSFFERIWYAPTPSLLGALLSPVLWPLSKLTHYVTTKKFTAHTQHPRAPYSAPVVVVGNISVGGTGKTPFLVWLATQLTQSGLNVGIVSRGYGATTTQFPHIIKNTDSAQTVGDEPWLLHERLGCPIVIDPNRHHAVEHLLKHHEIDVVLSDDGMQHYAMHRDLEIALIDGTRGLGNEKLLPAGPLREAKTRLNHVDYLVSSVAEYPNAHLMTYQLDCAIAVCTATPSKRLASFSGQTVHAVAGIGHPQRFFDALERAGVNVIPHAFSDHYRYSESDLHFNDDLPVLMTEKDAVKCRKFLSNKLWYLPMTAELHHVFQDALVLRIHELVSSHTFNSQVDIKA